MQKPLSNAAFFIHMLLVLPLESALCRDSYTFEGTNWTVSWAVAGSNITFAMFGPADGWIGVGFTSSLSQPVRFTAFFAILHPPALSERYLSSCNTNTT